MATRMGIANFLKKFPSIDRTDSPNTKDKVCITVPQRPKPRTISETELLQLNQEVKRLETFANWNVPFIDKEKLAMLGFYYIGPNDMVKCFFCRVEIGMWEEGDDVLTDHERWSPYCNLIRRRSTNNVPINAERLDACLPAATASLDVSGSPTSSGPESPGVDDVHMIQHQLFNQGGFESVFNAQLPVAERLKHPEHPEYAVEANRLKSFEDWPKTMRQKPQELSDAGFFYTGKGDRVACFSCGGGLKDWEENDVPWEQHGMWYGKCEYVRLVKGDDFVRQMDRKRELELKQQEEKNSLSVNANVERPCSSNSNSSMDTMKEKMIVDDEMEAEEEKKPVNESKLCKICFINEYNTAFYPCGHVIACAKCASSVTKCPCCRQPFNNVIRVYFS
jgi:baculoviral IAP repeat-containing protein 7/8